MRREFEITDLGGKVVGDFPKIAEHDVAALIREADHRVANALASLAGYLHIQSNEIGRRERSMAPREVQLLLQDIGLRIDAVGRLHRLLSRQATEQSIDLGAHLTEVANIVTASFEGVEMVNSCERGCIVDAVKAGSVALIVSELITNAAKYAHPSGIPVQIDLGCHWRADGQVAIRVADDGVGLPEGFDPKVDGGLGMRVIRALTAQLGATLSMQSSSLGLVTLVLLP